MEADGTVDRDLSFNEKFEVSLIYALALYFKEESPYSDWFAEMQLKPDTGLSGGNFSKYLVF